MASPQTEKGFIRVANELYEEILRRDFSKRQQNILLFVMRLSYGCGRKYCEIPKYNYFELAGLNKSDVKKELKYLRECKVLDWSEDDIKYSINKNYDFWQISPSKGFEKDRLIELISINLKGKKVGEIPTKEVGEIPTNNDIEVASEVGEIPTDIRSLVGELLTKELAKYQLSNAVTPTGSKAEAPPKESIKESIKENNIYIVEIVDYLNSVCNKKFKSTTEGQIKFIRARLKEGNSVEDLKSVIDKKAAQWLGTTQEKYLRPSTLFNAEKFEAYMNESSTPKRAAANNSWVNDWQEAEKGLNLNDE